MAGNGEEPLGPRKFDFESLNEDDFEAMCHEIVRLEFREVAKTDRPDGGADSLLPKKDKGWERGWQAKRFTGHIYWGQCKEALDRLVGTYKVDRVTFCFAKNLTKNQQIKFDSDLKGRHRGVQVDFLDRAALSARLNSDEGKKIARHYFCDPTHTDELMTRAFRAGGKLDTGQHAIERGRPIGEFLGDHDPFFRYSQTSHEKGLGPPASEDTVISVTSTEGGISVRQDAIPRHPEAMERYGPQIKMRFTDDDRGKRAAEAFAEATKRGIPLSLKEGVEITAEQLPPLWEELVGETIGAQIQIKPHIPPWRAEVSVKSDKGKASLVMLLQLQDEAPKGWEICLKGWHGGLTFSVLMRRTEKGGEITMNWSHTLGTEPARAQLEAMRLVVAMHGDGELAIRDLEGGRPELRHPTEDREVGEDGLAVLGLLEDMVTIEDWIGQQIPIPDRTITANEAEHIAMTAAFVREKAIPVRWEHAKAEVGPKGVEALSSPSDVTVVQDMGMRLFGNDYPLCRGTLVMPEVKIYDRGSIEGTGGYHRVEFLPPGGEPLSLQWEIEPPATDPEPTIAV
ncbi:MAG: hypothetical protein U0R52_02755 [Solirubrobacterales bacterium]